MTARSRWAYLRYHWGDVYDFASAPPVVEQMFTWRTENKLGVVAITHKLSADTDAYPRPTPPATTAAISDFTHRPWTRPIRTTDEIGALPPAYAGSGRRVSLISS